MSKDSEFYDYVRKYIDENPDACEVMAMAHELAKHIEDSFGYSRKTVCEGLFVAALDMAICRLDDEYFQNPDTTRAFYAWALEFLQKKGNELFTKEEQMNFEEVYGKGITTCIPTIFYKKQ